MTAAVRIVPLGGLGEIGMNALVLEQDGEAIVIDCGVTFDDRGLGVDVVHPDFSPLESLRVRGVVITHGHEDHIGALPYFLRRHDVPVYGPKYALGLVKERLAEHEVLRWARLIETHTREPFTVGPFTIEPVRVTHSIADATALLVKTAAGTVVHTGDFKFDESPPDGETFDEERLRAAGDEGVALLLSDSTNIDARGDAAGSEASVADALAGIVEKASGAVIVALFASNVHRLRILGDIARATGRKIVPFGRGVQTHARVAQSTGYLAWPAELTWPSDRARELPRNKVLGIATGTQAEARAALARLARNDFNGFELSPEDTVVLSSRVIPGNEPEVYALMNDLLRRGVDLRSWLTDRAVHVSGHAHAGEQRRMIDLVRPRSFIPVHGTLHHLRRHAELARERGVDDALVIENGDVAALTTSAPTLQREGRWSTGRVHVFAGRAIAPATLKERQAIAQEGVALVTVPVDARGALAGPIAITTRGVLEETEDAALLEAARRDAASAVTDVPRFSPDRPNDDAVIADAARLAVRRALARALGFKPVTVAHVVRAGRARGET